MDNMFYKKSFFILENKGNNSFSFEERNNKKIHVASIIDGEIDDVKIGNETAFSEMIDGKEQNSYGLENFVKLKNKNIYIFDNHNHSFYFWCLGLKENIFKKNLLLVHVDQHKDMREPKELDVNINDLQEVFDYTNYQLNVGNFIKPALSKDIFKDVLIIDSSYSFESKINEEYVLDLDLDIFSKDMDYIDWDYKIKKIKKLIRNAKFVTIATSPFFIEFERVKKALLELF
ncbi:UPF0489 family protein [Peptostreptococcaceae bacterium AGR-M142]